MGIEVNFKGKVALVTGASSGLGARFATVLAQAGATVVLAARRTERLKELRAEIEAAGGAARMVQRATPGLRTPMAALGRVAPATSAA